MFVTYRVEQSIEIVVANGKTHAEHHDVCPRCLRYVGEAPSSVVRRPVVAPEDVWLQELTEIVNDVEVNVSIVVQVDPARLEPRPPDIPRKLPRLGSGDVSQQGCGVFEDTSPLIAVKH